MPLQPVATLNRHCNRAGVWVMYISHPNLLPIIDVSETLFPFCVMSPWMPDGNITQYTRVNPDTNRLMLVCAH
jgi:hypothetical protein